MNPETLASPESAIMSARERINKAQERIKKDDAILAEVGLEGER